jgi:hypothetical protein
LPIQQDRAAHYLLAGKVLLFTKSPNGRFDMADNRTHQGIPMFPTAFQSRADEDEAVIEKVIETIPGETEMDRIIKAQSSAPHIIDRMVKLENCIWSLTHALLLLPEPIQQKIGAKEAIEQARLLLHKSRVMDHNLELQDPPPSRTTSGDDQGGQHESGGSLFHFNAPPEWK